MTGRSSLYQLPARDVESETLQAVVKRPDARRGGKRVGAGRKSTKVAGHGGKQPHAGRKSNPALRDAAARILQRCDGTFENEVKEWGRLLYHRNVTIRLRARIELTKLVYPVPKPVDAKVAGTVNIHFHRIDPKWRRPPSGHASGSHPNSSLTPPRSADSRGNQGVEKPDRN